MALGSTQPLTEMSTRNLPGGEGRPASVSRFSRKFGSLDLSQPCGPPQSVLICSKSAFVGTEVLTAATQRSTIFWNMTPRSPVEAHRVLEKRDASTFRAKQ
jgi:hypothetical protein